MADVEAFKTKRLQENRTVRGMVEGTRKQTNKKIQAATVNRELACLRLIFNHAIKGDVPLTNPIRKTGAKTFREENEQTRVLSFDEQTRYLAKATPFLFDVATIMLEAGMRSEEVYRILPENVHIAEGYLFNPYGKTRAAKRRVAPTEAAREALVRRIAIVEQTRDALVRRIAIVEQTRDALQRNGKQHDVMYVFPHAGDVSKPVPKVNNAHDRAVRDSGVAGFASTTFAIRGRLARHNQGLISSRWRLCSDTQKSIWLCVMPTQRKNISERQCFASKSMWRPSASWRQS